MKGVLYLSEMVQLNPLFGYPLNTDTSLLQTVFFVPGETQEKKNGFLFLDILGYLKNTHKNPKFGRVRQVPVRELGWKFSGWDLSHFAKFGIFMGALKHPKMGIRYFFL